MTSIWTLVIVTVQPTVTGVSLTKWSNPINYLQETNNTFQESWLSIRRQNETNKMDQNLPVTAYTTELPSP